MNNFGLQDLHVVYENNNQLLQLILAPGYI